MCDFFWQRSMDGGGGGDLVDIIRSVGGPRSEVATGDSWQFPTDADESFQNFSTDEFAASYADAFDLLDTPLNELVGTTFSDCSPDMSYNDSCGGGDGGGSIQKPKNLFSRVVQVLPAKHSTLAHRMIRPFPMVTDGGVHISSPQAPGIKRRKNPVKKVVCIPAPTAANSARPSSAEVVPSDLWAWRKYGQKPIKGSPYPRGYYRCSSSKGCLARKQVERSRSDPNMLVITYTSEHNHPWPTQRNSLAGSTRSSNPNKNHKITPPPKISNLKDELINTTTSSSSLTTKTWWSWRMTQMKEWIHLLTCLIGNILVDFLQVQMKERHQLVTLLRLSRKLFQTRGDGPVCEAAILDYIFISFTQLDLS